MKSEVQINNLYGFYNGTTNVGRTAHLSIVENDTLDFVINSLVGITYPGIVVGGNVNGLDLILNDYECNHCPGLPTPGGYPRYYSSTLSGNGIWYPENDSIVLFLDYKQTGDFNDEFVGEVYLKKD